MTKKQDMLGIKLNQIIVFKIDHDSFGSSISIDVAFIKEI